MDRTNYSIGVVFFWFNVKRFHFWYKTTKMTGFLFVKILIFGL